MSTDSRTGLLFALAGFSLLSVGDAVIKTMAGQWSPVAIAALRFTIAAVVLSAMLGKREGAGAFRLPHWWIQAGRGAALGLSALAFFTSLFVMPLATATALTFTSPILTALLAGPLLGEPPKRQTWIASLAAFAGVLIILRPNLVAVGWAAALPLVSAVGFSLLIIANRFVAGKASGLAMQASVAVVAAAMLIVFAPLFALTGEPRFALGLPDWTVIARCAVVALFASTAHWLIYLGTTRAGAASIAPMSYAQMLVAGTIGWAWFGDRPDLMTLLGAAIIIAAGLYLWRAGQVREPTMTD
jgi:drug/metabolite transporter (DMT)-like permease